MHHMQKARLAKQERSLATMFMQRYGQKPPVRCPLQITLTRVGPRPLDRDNNFRAHKHLIDGIADWLGMKDNDPLLHFDCRQRKDKRYSVEIEIRADALKAVGL
jgi:hypothetical protein